jgi:hypothetical protein
MSAPPPPIRRRLVLHAPGFEPLQPAQHRDRFARALERTARLWSLAAGCGPLRAGETSGAAPRLAAWAEGPDWRCESEIRLLAWDHLIRAELDRGGPALLARGGAALLDLLASGTLARYARVHWRYALFALYPMALLASGFGAAAGTAAALGGAGGLIAGGGVLAGGLAWARRRAMLDVMLADWRFAWDAARGRHAGFQAVVEGAAREIAAAMEEPGCEEVVLLGHSLGAVFAVQGLALALRRDPGLLERPGAPRFALIGLGSSVLKIALHPAAEALRRDVAQLAATPGLVWREHASRRDALSFERAEPVATLGLPGRGPRLRGVHPRDMVDSRTWRRICWQPLRIHRQYVMGNGRRYFLDIGMIACGPLPVSSGLDPDRALGAEGALGRAPAPAG